MKEQSMEFLLTKLVEYVIDTFLMIGDYLYPLKLVHLCANRYIQVLINYLVNIRIRIKKSNLVYIMLSHSKKPIIRSTQVGQSTKNSRKVGQMAQTPLFI